MGEPAIQTLGLTKFYGKHRGVQNIDLTVDRGEIFGFLGPNGSGKSTTIRLLLDLIRPSSGAASVLGLNPRLDAVAVRERVGYLPGDLAMYDHMTGRQLCRYFGALRGLDVGIRVDHLAERLSLDLDRPIGDYSTGNRQKVGLTQAFMHDPELLILDEPTSGLDPLVRQEFYAMVDEVRSTGRTVFLSSHLLPEVEHVADRVAIVREGQVVVEEDVATLKRRAVRSVEIQFGHEIEADHFDAVAAVRRVDRSEDRTTLVLVVEGSIDEVVKTAARFEVHNIISHDGDLEDVFLEYYRGDPEAESNEPDVSQAPVDETESDPEDTDEDAAAEHEDDESE